MSAHESLGSSPGSPGRAVAVVVGTRPEVIKLAPVVWALRRRGIPHVLVSTGQHDDLLRQTSEALELSPDYDLHTMRPGQSLAELSAGILERADRLFAELAPSWVVVQGDTTTVSMMALAAFYRRIPVAHVEAGLRTHRRYDPYPEEMNRALMGPLGRLHFAPTETARRNLLRQGVPETDIQVVGNTVVDALGHVLENGRSRCLTECGLGELEGSPWVLVTLHRRENFGEPLDRVLVAIAALAGELAREVAIVFPVHPNPEVRQAVEARLEGVAGVRLVDPLPYGSFLRLLAGAEVVISDSGGVQEEATALGVPVLVTRATTERPEAIAAGVAELVGTDPERIIAAALKLLRDPEFRARRARATDVFGDGRAGERIVEALAEAGAGPVAEAGGEPLEPPPPARRQQVVWVVLPAYDEEATLAGLLESIDESLFQAGLAYRVVLVDDGSRDRTLAIAEAHARHLPVTVVRHETNLGLGAAIRDGLVKAASLADPRDILVTMDADQSHTPQLILRMVYAVREGHDVVIASRFRPGSRVLGVPLLRRFLSRTGSWLLRLLFPIPGVRDFTCGYRAYRAGVIQEVLESHGAEFFEQTGFQCMVDILLKLRRRGPICGEVPLVLRYDLKGGPSKMNVWRTTMDTLALLVRRRFLG